MSTASQQALQAEVEATMPTSNVIAFPTPDAIEEPVSQQIVEVMPGKKPRIKKPKVLRTKVFRPKTAKSRYSDAPAAKLILEHLTYFRINFPETESEKYRKDLEAIPGCAQIVSRPIFNPENIDLVAHPEKTVFLQSWSVPQSEESLQQVAAFGRHHRFMFSSDIAVRAHASTSDGKRLEKMSYAKSNSTVQVPQFMMFKEPGTKVAKRLKPYPFQLAGIAYALETKRCFIADEMGLGKTIQGIGVMHTVKKWPWLVVVPASLKINWSKECKKWMGKKRNIHILSNDDVAFTFSGKTYRKWEDFTTSELKTKALRIFKKRMAEHEIIIINYDRLSAYAEYLKQIKWVGTIFDESHYLKARGTKRFRTVKDLFASVDPEYRLMLTGTPITNKTYELIPQLTTIDRLSEFGGNDHFERRYCSFVNIDTSAALKARDDGDSAAIKMEQTSEELSIEQKMQKELVRQAHSNFVELNTRLRSICYVRREKSDVLTDLPSKTRSSMMFNITNMKEYQRVERDVIGWLMDLAEKDQKFLKKIEKLSKEEQIRKIREHRNETGNRSARVLALQRINQCKQVAAVGKLAAGKEWCDNFLESGEKLVIFAHHKAILNELISYYPGCAYIVGGMSDKARDEAVTKFQSDPKCKVFIGSIKAAGVGLTLTKASNVVFFEMAWTPTAHDQAEDRCHRITQKSAVNCYYLIAKGTIEERIARLLEQKRGEVDATSTGNPLKGENAGSILGDLIQSLIGKRVKL